MLIVLEGAFEIDDPRILGEGEDVPLCTYMCHLVLVNHFILFHLFDSDNFPCLFLATNANLAKGSPSNDFDRLKVSDSDSGATIF